MTKGCGRLPCSASRDPGWNPLQSFRGSLFPATNWGLAFAEKSHVLLNSSVELSTLPIFQSTCSASAAQEPLAPIKANSVTASVCSKSDFLVRIIVAFLAITLLQSFCVCGGNKSQQHVQRLDF